MPVLGLGEQDASDLVSFLEAEASRLHEAQNQTPLTAQQRGDHAHHH
jgi:hypothetical protein